MSDHLTAVLDAIDQASSATIKQARRRGLSKGAEEVIQREADDAKRRVRELILDYPSAKPATLETLCRPEHDRQLVRVRCAVAGMERPVQVERIRDASTTAIDLLGTKAADYDQNRVIGLQSALVLSSEHCPNFETEPFLDRQLIESLQEKLRVFAMVEVLLFVVAGAVVEDVEPDADDAVDAGQMLVKGYRAFVVDARPLDTALQVVAPTPGEQEEARRRYGNQDDLLAMGTELLLRRLEIQEHDSLPVLTEAIRFEVLNAATEGMRGHSMLIGPPGVGKSTVVKAGAMVQPVHRWTLPTKITEAGLIGSGNASARNRKPGLVPRAHTGMLSIEDANQMNKVKNQRIMSCFTTVMQDGVVSDTSISCTEYRAEVAIHLDANRKSDVRRTSSNKDGLDRLVEDTGVPLNVLTRMTYIAEIPRDPAVQMKVAFKIMEKKRQTTEVEIARLGQEIRYLQVWMAMMRHDHPKVEVADDVRKVIQERMGAAFNTAVARLDRHVELGDFLPRLGEQALMLVSAHARMHDRNTANLTDVDAIYPFVWRKLDFIRTVLFGSQISEPDTTAAAKGRRICIDLALKRRHATVFTLDDIRRWTGMTSATRDAMQGDLRVLYGDPDTEGRYRVLGVLDPVR